eukprot:130663_1
MVELKTWWMSRNITSVMNDKLHDYDTTHYVLCISLIVLVWWYFVYTYPRTTFLYTKSTQTKETCLDDRDPYICDPCLNALLSVHEQITNRSSFLDSLCSFLCSFCWSTPSSWLDKYVQSIGNEDFASVLVFVFILFVKHV